MSYVEDVARSALNTAHSDLAKAHRALLLIAGLLALIHLLTVHPYLRVSREMEAITTQRDAEDALLARLNPEIERLRTAQKDAGEQITDVLDRATKRMMEHFTRLRALVGKVSSSEETIPALLAGYEPSRPVTLRQTPRQIEQMQWTGPTRPQMQMQMREPRIDVDALKRRLTEIFEALREGAPDAYERLAQYAKHAIVEPAYASAHAEWIGAVRPAYLGVLGQAERTARELAEQAPTAAAEEADALRSAADDLAAARQTLAAIDIGPDHHIDEALGTEWWHTVEGKEQFADAIALSIKQQMQAITETSTAPAAAIGRIRQRQEGLRVALLEQRKALERQFETQSRQLATLSGATGVLPVDLVTFIGVFPLVVGLVLGLLLLRVGQARHDAARATAELALAAPEDRETMRWLARRALGGGNARGTLLLTGLLALGACVWIIAAALQLKESPVRPSVSGSVATAIGVAVVLAAAVWDMWAIGLLDRAQRR